MCRGGVEVGQTPFSLVALLQTLACYVGGPTHTRITRSAEHNTACTLFYKPGKVLSLCQNKKITSNEPDPYFKIRTNQYFLIEKYSLKLNDFKISKNSNYPDSNCLDSTVLKKREDLTIESK